MSQIYSEQELAVAVSDVETYFSRFVADEGEVDESDFDDQVIKALTLAADNPNLVLRILNALRVPADEKRGLTAKSLGEFRDRISNDNLTMEEALLAIGSTFAEDLEDVDYGLTTSLYERDARDQRYGDFDEGVTQD